MIEQLRKASVQHQPPEQNALTGMFNALKRAPGKTTAVESLGEVGDKFPCETSSSVAHHRIVSADHCP